MGGGEGVLVKENGVADAAAGRGQAVVDLADGPGLAVGLVGVGDGAQRGFGRRHKTLDQQAGLGRMAAEGGEQVIKTLGGGLSFPEHGRAITGGADCAELAGDILDVGQKQNELRLGGVQSAGGIDEFVQETAIGADGGRQP